MKQSQGIQKMHKMLMKENSNISGRERAEIGSTQMAREYLHMANSP